jgi:3'-phosphoadenosine 5'-phosphosulfate sulfotransferase
MINNILKKIEKANEVQNVELEKHEVDLVKSITEIEKAYNDGLTLNKQFDSAISQYKQTAQVLAKIAEDFNSKYITVVMDGKETLKAITDLGITGPDVNWLKTAVTQFSEIRNKIKNPTDYLPRK